MSITVKVDQQGRLVIPQRERERLGVRDGGTLEMIPTSEGLLLERRRAAAVRLGDDGLPVATIDGLDVVTNDEAVAAVHSQRERE